jgi:chemotaxis response regulator CheB
MFGVWYAKEAIIAGGADKILPLSDIPAAILVHITRLSNC